MVHLFCNIYYVLYVVANQSCNSSFDELEYAKKKKNMLLHKVRWNMPMICFSLMCVNVFLLRFVVVIFLISVN
jgi:hypothetical protein